MSVLVEKQGSRDGQITGRSPFMQSVYMDGRSEWVGQIIDVQVDEARQNSLLVRPKVPPETVPIEGAA